jgi:hypothetical protein
MRVIVKANFTGDDPLETAAALGLTAGWLALVLHTIAVEVYVGLCRFLVHILHMSNEQQVNSFTA